MFQTYAQRDSTRTKSSIRGKSDSKINVFGFSSCVAALYFSTVSSSYSNEGPVIPCGGETTKNIYDMLVMVVKS